MRISEDQARFARFVIVGVGAAVLLFVLTYGFELAGAAPIWGYGVAYIIAFFVAYNLQRAWTFGAQHRHKEAFPKYLALQIACATSSALLGQALTNWSPLPGIAISATCTVVASALSFLGGNYWVFASKDRGRA